jgi:hypothetical protein
VLADVGAVGRAARRDPEQPEQAEDVVDAQRRRVAERRAQRLDVRPVGGGPQLPRDERRDLPVLPLRAEVVGRGADADVAAKTSCHTQASAPSGSTPIGRSRIRGSSAAAARAARRAATGTRRGTGSAWRAGPGSRRRPAAGIVEAGRPRPPAAAVHLRDRHEGGEQLERLALLGAVGLEAGLVARASGPPTTGTRAPVAWPPSRRRGRCARCCCGRRRPARQLAGDAFDPRHRGDVEVEQVTEATRRRVVGAGLAGRLRDRRVQRVDEGEPGAGRPWPSGRRWPGRRGRRPPSCRPSAASRSARPSPTAGPGAAGSVPARRSR